MNVIFKKELNYVTRFRRVGGEGEKKRKRKRGGGCCVVSVTHSPPSNIEFLSIFEFTLF